MYYFTFGVSHPYGQYVVPVTGNYEESRRKMCSVFGTKWCGQYSEKDYQRLKDKYNYKELPLISRSQQD
jgi:hypothetical protein